MSRLSYKTNMVYVGIADESYWRKQPGIDTELIRDFPITQGTYISCINGDSQMNYSHDPLTFLGAMEVIYSTLGDMVISSFPKKHRFRKMEGQRNIDGKTRELLIQRFGEDSVRT